MDKKWILCSVVEWNDFQKLSELREGGVKKNTDPYLASEYLMSLLRSFSPVLVFTNFEPEESFNGLIYFNLSFFNHNYFLIFYNIYRNFK